MTDDQARVAVSVRVPPAAAFRIFTEEIDQWWRRGLKYRIAPGDRGILVLEPGVGGRLIETFETVAGTKVIQTGTVRLWEPPSRLVFAWRAVNFGPEDPDTRVDVTFDPTPQGTLVTLTHAGWSFVRPDHPVRHGEASAAFLRRMGLWWGDLMSAMRVYAQPS